MIPVTFCCPIPLADPEKQNAIFRIFADNGGKHIVLDSSLLASVLANPGVLNDLVKRMNSFDLDFMDAHAIWGTWADPGIPLEDFRLLASFRARATFRICKMLNVRTITFHTGNTLNNTFGQFTMDDYWNALRRSLEEFLPEAERCDLIISLENQWTPLNHSSYLLKAIDWFRSPYLGLCLDTGHAHLMEKGMNDPGKSVVPRIWDEANLPVDWDVHVMDNMAPHLVNCHIHDNFGLNDSHLLPGEGDIDWERVKKLLFSAPRLQSIMPEVSCGDSAESVQKVFSSVKKTMAFQAFL